MLSLNMNLRLAVTLLCKISLLTIIVTSPVRAFTDEHIIASFSKVPAPVTNHESVKPMLDYAQGRNSNKQHNVPTSERHY